MRPARRDALDALDVSDATCLHRTQRAMAPCVRTQLTRAPCVRTRSATAYAYRSRSVRALSFQTQPCYLDAAVASGRSAWLLGLRTPTTRWRYSGHGGGVITAKTSITCANTQRNPVLFIISNVHLYMLPHSGIQRRHTTSYPPPRFRRVEEDGYDSRTPAARTTVRSKARRE